MRVSYILQWLQRSKGQVAVLESIFKFIFSQSYPYCKVYYEHAQLTIDS